MAEGKYGRLFTERDVALLVGVAYSVGWRDGARFVEQGFGASRAPTGRDELLAHVLERTARDHALTFSPDEPLFLLRGRDGIAWPSVEHYAVHCDVNRNVPADHASAAHDASDVFREWQEQHPDRVKAPD